MTSKYIRAPWSVTNDIPIFLENFDSYARNYADISKDHLNHVSEFGDNPFMLDQQIEEAVASTRRVINGQLSSGSKVLDAGIGMGDLLDGISGIEKFGVDISLDYLLHAKSKGIEVALANIEDLPYQDNFFDLVVTTDVLEHVLRLDTAVEELLRVLKPGGKLVVRVPNEENLDSYSLEGEKYEYSHLRNFSLSGLQLYLTKTFDLEYLDHEFSGYLFGSADQLLIKSPKREDQVRELLEQQRDSHPELDVLRKTLATSEEEIVDALISIRDSIPDLAKKLIPLLVQPTDVTTVFRKAEIDSRENRGALRKRVTRYPEQGFGAISSRVENVLVLCYYETNGVPTVPETVAYLQELSSFSVTVLNLHVHRKDTGYIRLRKGLNLNAFSAIVIHNSLSYNVDNIREIDRDLEVSLSSFQGVKVLMKQDENYRFTETAAFILQNGIDLVFTCLPPESIDAVYPGALEAGVRFERMLTGYVTPSLLDLDFLGAERSIDIGYRGSIQPLSFGRLAYEKRQIGVLVQGLSNKTKLTTDISSEWSDRLGGDSWIRFLASCHATLGSESGASVFDLKGDLQARCKRAEAKLGPFQPEDEYAEGYLAELKDLENNVRYHQVSPRHFEAAATRTLQILYPGEYSGIFKPGKHFFQLERDGSNFQDAVALLADPEKTKKITDAAHRDVICNPEYSIGQFVARFDTVVGQLLEGAQAKVKKLTQTPPGNNVVLLAAHEPSIDPRLGWIESYAELPLRIHQVGVLPPTKSGPSVDISENASLAQAFPRQVYVEGFATSLFPLVGSTPAGMVGIQELSFIESLLQMSDFEFAEILGAPLDHERNGQFKWYLRYILDTSATLIDSCRRKRGVSAIIATDLDTLPAALVLKAMFDVPVVYDAHEYWPESDPASVEFEKQFWCRLERRLVAHADFRQTVTPGLAELMSEEYSSSFLAVPNCEPLVEREPRADRQSSARCNFLFQGNFAPHRGLELLVKMWGATCKEAVLLLRGPDCAYKNEIMELARSEGLFGSRILFPSAVSEADLVDACRDGDVGIIPYEPVGTNYRNCCPNKMSQYMASGMPILANLTDFVQATINDAGCGIVVDFSRTSKLVEQVDYFCKQPKIRHQMGRRGLAYYQSSFNWQVVSRPLYHILESYVLDKPVVSLVDFEESQRPYYLAGSLEVLGGKPGSSAGDCDDSKMSTVEEGGVQNIDVAIDSLRTTSVQDGYVDENKTSLAYAGEDASESQLSSEDEYVLNYDGLSSGNKLAVRTWRRSPVWLRKRLVPLAHIYKFRISEKLELD